MIKSAISQHSPRNPPASASVTFAVTSQLVKIASLLALIAVSATAQADFSLVAPPGTFQANATLQLARHDVDLRSTHRILETQTASDGSLSLRLTEDTGILYLNFPGNPEIILAPSQNETLAFSKKNSAINVSGSPGTKILQRYEEIRKESLARLVYPVRAEIKNAKIRLAGDEEIAILTQNEVDAYQAHLRELNDFVLENAGSTMALYGTSLRWNADYRADELAQLVERFSAQHGKIAATRSLENRIETFRHTALGATAPDLTASSPNGQTDSLANYRGHYVLVDFWASWCPPCRVENQHYSQIIAQADRSRFTILAVNLDTQQKAWTQAIDRDRADWQHISDLQGWTSPLASAYGVTALPASFLLDPEGKVIAKNLRGAALSAKLSELNLLKK